MMNIPQITNKQFLSLIKTYWQWRLLWVGSTLAFGLLGLGYVLTLKKDTWVATQGLIVRDEAAGAVMRLGRFQSQTEMKAAQETILEMARNPQVVSKALTAVGRDVRWPNWAAKVGPPTSGEVDDVARSAIEVRAPRGAELGTTEVIYLDVQESTPERAVQLNVAICEELEHHLKQVRQARADGVIAELKSAAASARELLNNSTQLLAAIEQSSGADLSDLRGLTNTNTGGNNNRQLLDLIKSEIRSVQLSHKQVSAELELAAKAFLEPDRLLAAPAKLLSQNPGMLKMREGLSSALIATSQLRGRFTEAHHSVVAALNIETKIREQLRKELGIAVQTLRQEVDLSKGRLSELLDQQSQLETRIGTLAEIRADYANIASEVGARNEQLQQADRELAHAVASREAAITSSLVTRLDSPIVGENPIGPGRSTILVGAAVSGLMFGLGIVFLLSPLDSSGAGYGRRSADAAGTGIGRRASDQVRLASGQVSDRKRATERQGEPERRSRDRSGVQQPTSQQPEVQPAAAQGTPSSQLAASEPGPAESQVDSASVRPAGTPETTRESATSALTDVSGVSFSQHANTIKTRIGVRPAVSKDNETLASDTQATAAVPMPPMPAAELSQPTTAGTS